MQHPILITGYRGHPLQYWWWCLPRAVGGEGTSRWGLQWYQWFVLVVLVWHRCNIVTCVSSVFWTQFAVEGMQSDTKSNQVSQPSMTSFSADKTLFQTDLQVLYNNHCYELLWQTRANDRILKQTSRDVLWCWGKLHVVTRLWLCINSLPDQTVLRVALLSSKTDNCQSKHCVSLRAWLISFCGKSVNLHLTRCLQKAEWMSGSMSAVHRNPELRPEVSQSEFFCHAANRFSLRQRGLGFEAYPEKLLRVNVGARILCFGARTLFILARFLHAETRCFTRSAMREERNQCSTA